MDQWVGKVAVVTGASAGIGAQIARVLAGKGLIVVGLARRNVLLQVYNVEKNIKIHPIKCDVTKEEDILKAFEIIEENFGGVDIMINNAGVSILSGLLDGQTESWKETFDINVIALNICTREALKSMRKRGDNGIIINVNSVSGHYMPKIPNIGPYSASKHAVTALTESLRNDLRLAKSNIKVTSISPGLVMTEMGKGIIKNTGSENQNNSATHGLLSPDDISDAIISILSFPPHVEIAELTIKNVRKAPYLP